MMACMIGACMTGYWIGQTDGGAGGQTDRRRDGWMDGWIHRDMDEAAWWDVHMRT